MTVLPDAEVRARFEQFAADKARSLLLEPHIGHDAEWAEGRLLGYGNTGLLLVSTYNTPAATLTCLWKENRENADWTPLLPRRKKE